MSGDNDTLVGTTLAGRYLVEKRIGQGGMGAVYIAKQHPLGRTVAIKVLLTGLADDAAATERFQREATLVASLNHPSIVTVYDFGQNEQGLWFIAMEFVAGKTLREVLTRHKRLAWPSAIDIVRQIAAALAVAHDAGVVHRDLKPDNVMLIPQKDGSFLVKVLDFGLAKLVAGAAAGADGAEALTQKSIIMGTPGYMAPEQIHGEGIDHRSDLYALGVMAWEMLVGRQPLKDSTHIKTLMRHLTDEIPPPSVACPEAAIPTRGDALIGRLLEKERERRPQRAADVAAAITALAKEPWAAPAEDVLAMAIGSGDWASDFTALEPAEPPDRPPAEALQSLSPKASIEPMHGSVGAPTAVLKTPPLQSALSEMPFPSPTMPMVPNAPQPPPPNTLAAPSPQPENPFPSSSSSSSPSPSPSPTFQPPPLALPTRGPLAPSSPSFPPSPSPSFPPPSPSFAPPPPLLSPPAPGRFGPPPMSASSGLSLADPTKEAASRMGPGGPNASSSSSSSSPASSPSSSRSSSSSSPIAFLTSLSPVARVVVGVMVVGVLGSGVHLAMNRSTFSRIISEASADPNAADLDEAISARVRTGTLSDIEAALIRARAAPNSAATDGAAADSAAAARVALLLAERGRLAGGFDDADEREARALVHTLGGDALVERRARGALLSMVGDVRGAVAAFAPNGAVDDDTARLLMAETLWRTDPEQAESILAARTYSAFGTRAQRVRGAIALARGELRAAEGFLDERLKAVPEDSTARGLRAHLHLARGNRAAALADVDAVLAHSAIDDEAGAPASIAVVGRHALATVAKARIIGTDPSAYAADVDDVLKSLAALAPRDAALGHAARLDILRVQKRATPLGAAVRSADVVGAAATNADVAVARAHALLATDDAAAALASATAILGSNQPITAAQRSRAGAIATAAALAVGKGQKVKGLDTFSGVRPLSVIGAVVAHSADVVAALPLALATPPARHIDDDERLLLEVAAPKGSVAKALLARAGGELGPAEQLQKVSPNDPVVLLISAAIALDRKDAAAAADRLAKVEARRSLDPRLKDVLSLLRAREAAYSGDESAVSRLGRLRASAATELVAMEVSQARRDDPTTMRILPSLQAKDTLTVKNHGFIQQ